MHGTDRSRGLHERARQVMPDGVGGFSQYRPPHPLYMAKAQGSRLYDLDGNEYTDYMLGAGAVVLGHAHPAVVRAVRGALEEAVPNLTAGERQIELAERLRRHFPSMERIRFLPSGTEANQAVIRLARAFTGRRKIAKFEAGYHGQGENVLVSVSAPRDKRGPEEEPVPVPYRSNVPSEVLGLTVVLPFNNAEAAVRLIDKHARDLAVVLVEAVLGFGGGIPAQTEYLHAVRAATDRHGILLAFDEVITGFRLGSGGAQELYGVRPDMTVLGKAIGGGLPVAAVGGRAEVMDLLSVEKHPDDYLFQSGTFSAHPLAVAAGLAAVKVMEDAAVFAHLDRLGELARAGLREVIEAAGYAVDVTGVGSLFQPHFTGERVVSGRQAADADPGPLREMHERLLRHGVYFYSGHLGFLSYAHQDADIGRMLDATRAVLHDMRAEGAR